MHAVLPLLLQLGTASLCRYLAMLSLMHLGARAGACKWP